MKMTMKKFIIVGGLVGFALLGLFLPAECAFHKEVTTEPGLELNVNLKAGGNMTITGWDQNKVSLNADIPGNNPDNWHIEVKKLATGITIKSDFRGKRHGHHGSAIYQLMVPKKYNLQLESMGGSITITGVEGNFSGKTMGGKLILSQLKGVINMKTMGGKISLTDSIIDGKVKTMGGPVLLENIVGDVSGSSMGGSVIYKNVKSRSGKSTGDVVNISTMGGDINVSEAAHGAKVHTMDGDILIKSAKEFITAKTMGGSITIEDISGWVKAETMGGNVSVTMTGDPKIGKRDVQLSSMGGDISLTVPENLSMAIEIQLTFTKNSHQNYKISSDFDVQQKTTDSWDTSKDSARKYIYAKGTVNGGTYKINIKTINGNVILKKK